MLLLAQEFHDIAPPVEYSLVPKWVIFLVTVVALSMLAAAISYARKRLRRPAPTTTARERALAALDREARLIETTAPYQFSIRLSDIVRQYVVEQFGLPMTRQTSIEFLNTIAASENFSED